MSGRGRKTVRIAGAPVVVLLIAALMVLAVAIPAGAAWGVVEKVSIPSGGGDGTGGSAMPAFSWDGRYVAFESNASNIVTDDSNTVSDVFVRDRATSTTRRVSLASDGSEGDGPSNAPAISGNGRFVAFTSNATNFAAGDTNAVSDVFLRDTVSNTVELISSSSAGDIGNGTSGDPSVSWDGRYVAFFSIASNLVSGDTNSWWDIFVKDRQSGVTQRVSISTAGVEGDLMSYEPAISFDGRYVSFTSRATTLITNDINGVEDVYVRDRLSGSTERVSISTAGVEGDGTSEKSSISYDGRYVSFESLATGLITDDANGAWDVFLRDRQGGTTRRVSVSDSGAQADGNAKSGALSWDGSRIAFVSTGTNVVSGDTNLVADAFVRDESVPTTYRTSIDGIQQVDGNVANTVISPDGRSSAFVTLGTFSPVISDGNGLNDIYLATSGESSLGLTPTPSPLPDLTPGPPPADPSNLEATPTSSSSIALTWSDNSTNENGFKVERRQGGGSFAQVATLGANVASYSDGGLAPSTSYSYRIRAANPDANSGYSNEVTATTFTATPPAAPSGLTATAISGSRIDLAWTDNSVGETGFIVERKTAGGVFTDTTTTAPDVTAISDVGLTPLTTYVYRARATGPGGSSGESNEATATTFVDTPPNSPSALAVVSTGPDQLGLSWTDNSSNELGFTVERSSMGSPFTSIAGLGADSTTFTDVGLKPATTYDYRVVATNSGGNSSYSNEATGTTSPAPVCKVTLVVFTSQRDGNPEIYLMDSDGSNQRRVTSTSSNESHPVITTGGDRIIFSSDEAPFRQIYSVNLDGSDRRPLTTDSANHDSPSISPDGKSIVFQSDKNGPTELWIMDADGTNQTQLTSGGTDALPAFAPASLGKVVVYVGNESGTNQIYNVSYSTGPSGGAPYVPSAPVRFTPSDTSNQWNPTYSPDGNRIAFNSDIDGPVQVYTAAAGGGDQQRITTDTAVDWKPAYSPDGKKIYFPTTRDAGDVELYAMKTDGSSQTRLTTAAGPDLDPSASSAHPWASAPSANFLAEGASTGGFETWVLASNPSSTSPVSACLTYLTSSGPVAGPVVTIPPQSRKSIRVNDTVATYNVSTVVEGIDGQVVAERAMYSSSPGTAGGHVGKAAPSPGYDWYMAEGSTAGGFDTWILVANPSLSDTAHVKVDFLTSSGQHSGPQVDIAPGQRQSFKAGAPYLASPEFDVSTHVTSTGAPVLAERASYVHNSSFYGATDSPAVPAAKTKWFLAEGAAAGPFTTWILVQNPQPSPVGVTIKYLTSGGEQTGPADVIPANSRKSYRVNNSVTDFNVSTEVQSTAPVVAERAMYTNDTALGRGAATGEGVSQTGMDWLAVEGAAAGGYTTWVLVANPNLTSACVNITFLKGTGPQPYGANPLCLGPRSRKSIRVNDSLTTFDVSTRVTSTTGPGVGVAQPVVVERTVYTPAGPTQDSTAGPAVRLS